VRRATAQVLVFTDPDIYSHPDRIALRLAVIPSSVIVSSFAGIAVVTLQASGKPETVTRLRLWFVPPFFLMQCWAVAKWGIDGAALGVLARLTIETAIMIVAARLETKDSENRVSP